MNLMGEFTSGLICNIPGGKAAYKSKKVNLVILLFIGIILLILWILGLFVFSLGALIRIAPVIGIIFFNLKLLRKVFRLFCNSNRAIGQM